VCGVGLLAGGAICDLISCTPHTVVDHIRKVINLGSTTGPNRTLTPTMPSTPDSRKGRPEAGPRLYRPVRKPFRRAYEPGEPNPFQNAEQLTDPR
jgi:hypothetical protein